MAFEWETLRRLRARASTLRLTGLLSRGGAERLGGIRAAAAELRALGADDLGVERTLLSDDAVATARAAGLTIGVWTVNDPDELDRALAAGVDYVTTDRPDLALARRRGRSTR
jgi:glycerophosphoryl diester phosphodiesterase